MDWSKGFTASYYAHVVDVDTWSDAQRVEILGGGVSCETSNLRQSADIEITEQPDRERYYRIYLETTQGYDRERIPLFTGLVASPDRSIDGIREKYRCECYSVLKPCADIFLPRGWYAPAMVSCEAILKQLLAATPAPKVIEDNVPMLSNAIIAEDDETNLSMVDRIIRAIGWELVVDGDGIINVRKPDDRIKANFDALDYDVIEPQVTVVDDWFNAPNVYRVISDDLVAIARDDNSDTPLSVAGRGREVWAQEVSADLADNESVSDYAIRRLKEEQDKRLEISYKRRFNPNVFINDMVRLHYPAQKIEGTFRVVAQSMSLGHNCQVTESVKEV